MPSSFAPATSSTSWTPILPRKSIVWWLGGGSVRRKLVATTEGGYGRRRRSPGRCRRSEDAADQFATYIMLPLAHPYQKYLLHPKVTAPLAAFSDAHQPPGDTVLQHGVLGLRSRSCPVRRLHNQRLPTPSARQRLQLKSTTNRGIEGSKSRALIRGSRRRPGLMQDRGSMGLDRLDADIQYFRDLLAAVALGDQPNDLCSRLVRG